MIYPTLYHIEYSVVLVYKNINNMLYYYMSIKIISCHPIFNENAVVLSKKFNWKLENEFDPQAGDLYIVYGAHEMSHQLLECQYRKNSSYGYIIMNSEQMQSQFMKNKYYIQLMKRNVVFDYNTITSDYLKSAFDVKVLSYYFFEFMRFNNETNSKEYDICFIGSKNEQREKLLDELQEEFQDLKFYVDFDWSHKSAESLTEILQKSKVVLNIGYYNECRPLETHRINKALASDCDVVSSLSDDTDANDFYKDYCYLTTDIKDTLHKYFNEELEKKKGYEELVKTLSQKFCPHMNFIITHVHEKLLSLNNTNATDTKDLPKPPEASGDNLSSNTETKDETGVTV